MPQTSAIEMKTDIKYVWGLYTYMLIYPITWAYFLFMLIYGNILDGIIYFRYDIIYIH